MLRSLILGSALLFALPTFARVVCTQPGFGVVTIDQSGGACAVKWVYAPNSPTEQTWNTVSGRCTEVYNGETYKMSAVLYSYGSPVTPVIAITRGTSTDVKYINVTISDDLSMNASENISCKLK